MNRIVLWALLMTTTMLAAQTQIAPAPPPPQSARQALLEMFLGQGPDHLKKHLPEITKKAFAKIESGATPSFLTEVEGIGMQARAGGGNLQTMETGPVLLVSDQPPRREKFEVTVERDDLIGDEDEIDLSFQMSRNGKLPAAPFIHNENGVGRLAAHRGQLFGADAFGRSGFSERTCVPDRRKTATHERIHSYIFYSSDCGRRDCLSRQTSWIHLLPFRAWRCELGGKRRTSENAN